MYHYTAYDLSLESELELPELLSFEVDGQADVKIRVGDVPQQLDGSTSDHTVFQASPNKFLLREQGVGRYLVLNGNEIVVSPSPESVPSDIRLFLLGSCLGALLHQRGVLALHASAVCLGDGAVLFTGPSGAGKSTLAAALLQRGHPLLADDVSAIVLTEGLPLVLPSFPRTKLWADAALNLGYKLKGLNRIRSNLDKYDVRTLNQFTAGRRPLKQIYRLTTSTSDRLDIEPIGATERFGILLRNTYRGHYLEGLDLRQSHFRLIARIANQVPLTRVVRPQSPNRLDELVDLIVSRSTPDGSTDSRM
jgi:hypothetical protein